MDVRKTIDNVDKLVERVNALTQSDVLVGVPKENTGRKIIGGEPVTNAQLAYWHEFGTVHIPARPFLRPGVAKAREQIAAIMQKGAQDVLKGGVSPDVILNRVGMTARNFVVKEITDPAPPFVPLAASTIRARLRRTAAGRRKLRGLAKVKAAAGWRSGNPALLQWAGETVQGDMNIHPLIDTGQLRASITYVIRPASRPGGGTWFGYQRDYGQTVMKWR